MNIGEWTERHSGATSGSPTIGMGDYELSAPIAVLIELTRQCNLRCLHCFSNSGAVVSNEFTTSEWIQFIDELAKIGVFIIFFGGGEPLCRKDLMDIAMYANDRRINCCLLSNLTLIDDKKAAELADVGFYKVEGNLDGHTAETYEELRQVKGSFEQTIRGIRSCLKAGLPVRINCTLTRLNAPYIEQIAELAAKLGVTDLAFIRLIPAGRGDANYRSLDFGESYYRTMILPRLKVLRRRYEGHVSIGYEQDQALISECDPNRLMPWCGTGRIHCTVTPHGYVKPDHSFPDSDPTVIAGNIRKESFEEIWKHSEVFKQIRHTYFPECEGCPHVGCVGGDVYRIYQHYGRLMAGRDPRCIEMGIH